MLTRRFNISGALLPVGAALALTAARQRLGIHAGILAITRLPPNGASCAQNFEARDRRRLESITSKGSG